MKKWFKFFSLSFFSDKASKDGVNRGYTNLFFGLLLAFAFLWLGMVGGEMLPFGTHYNNAPDFAETVHVVFSNPALNDRVEIEIEGGLLKAKKQGGEYADALVINTLTNEGDRQVYGVKGYDVVVDTRPADTLAEIEVYCISNDGKDMTISYEEYLSLSTVAKMNFDFHLKYTGNALVLTEEMVTTYKQYVVSLGETQKSEVEKLENDLLGGTITQGEYDRAMYQLYFTNYYPAITAYEGTSKVPLLRNYYYHEYINTGKYKYLFIFDDCLSASFETNGGIRYSFYGFYSGMENGTLIDADMDANQAISAADDFINASYDAMAPLTFYAHAVNIFSFIPFIALMPLAVALLAYSILKLRGVDSIKTFGGLAKIIGSYLWFSGVVAAVLTVALSFFVEPGAISAIPLALFFVVLAVRSIIFAIHETKAFMKQMEKRASQTEV